MKNLADCHVLVTPTSFGQHDPSLKKELEDAVGRVTWNPTGKPLDSATLARLLPDVDGCIAGLDTIDAAALACAPRLRVIARYGVGVDNVDREAARSRGIVVTNTPGANSVAVAELTIALMLNLLRPLPAALAATRAGGWPRMPGYSLEGRTVGLVGLGAIGRAVTRRLAGFDCTLLAHDILADPAFAHSAGVELVPLEALLERSHIVSLHVPVTAETRGMVSQAFLARMRKGSFLINTARGELVDEAALLAALVDGQLGGAALDVFAKEPPGSENPLLALPNVLPTPHMGAHTDGATNAMGRMALADCLAILRGEEPKHRVD